MDGSYLNTFPWLIWASTRTLPCGTYRWTSGPSVRRALQNRFTAHSKLSTLGSMFLHISQQRVALSKSILSINEEEAYKLASVLSKVPLLYKYGLTLTIDIQHIEYRLSIFPVWLTTLHCQTTSLKIDIQHILQAEHIYSLLDHSPLPCPELSPPLPSVVPSHCNSFHMLVQLCPALHPQ